MNQKTKLDRILQKKVLSELSEIYPARDIPESLENIDEAVAAANIEYLYEHGLIEEGVMTMLSGATVLCPTKITAKGLDFIQGDGGLSAVLGVLTVRLEIEQFREILAIKIAQSNLPEESKNKYLEHLKDLPAEMLSQAAKRALDLGLDQLSELASSLGNIFGL